MGRCSRSNIPRKLTGLAGRKFRPVEQCWLDSRVGFPVCTLSDVPNYHTDWCRKWLVNGSILRIGLKVGIDG